MSTLRNDLVAGLYGLLTGFLAANPTSLNSVYRSRPASLGDRPLAFVGLRNERINHTGQVLFQRQPTPNVAFVWASGADQRELADVRDDVVDAFVTYAIARPHAISNQTTCSPTGVEDVELEMDGAFYPASIVTFEVFGLEGSL